jgi:hypothetical protein
VRCYATAISINVVPLPSSVFVPPPLQIVGKTAAPFIYQYIITTVIIIIIKTGVLITFLSLNIFDLRATIWTLSIFFFV